MGGPGGPPTGRGPFGTRALPVRAGTAAPLRPARAPPCPFIHA
ncbi:hypothetical protein STTU_1849 [Streptomyces sp. Tu6071]|nr:hypothetical protein STTU_1849 [Streptomyces sp. Tu6071]